VDFYTTTSVCYVIHVCWCICYNTLSVVFVAGTCMLQRAVWSLLLLYIVISIVIFCVEHSHQLYRKILSAY